jgi:hypothetical protein
MKKETTTTQTKKGGTKMMPLEHQARIKYYFSQPGYIVKNDVVAKGVKCKYAVYDKEACLCAIREETYMKYKDEIEQLIAQARELKKKNEEAEREKERKEQEEREEAERRARENIHVVLYDKDWETGRRIYVLSSRVDRATWEKIKHCMYFFDTSHDLHGEWNRNFRGWAVDTDKIEELENILNVKPELRLKAQEERAKREKEEREAKAKLIAEYKKKIDKVFENAEYVKPENGLICLTGEAIEHPADRWEKGVGQMFVIQKNEGWIWRVWNNSTAGDDWQWNNVYISGETGQGIGRRVKYSEEIEQLIREFARLNKKNT